MKLIQIVKQVIYLASKMSSTYMYLTMLELHVSLNVYDGLRAEIYCSDESNLIILFYMYIR